MLHENWLRLLCLAPLSLGACFVKESASDANAPSTSDAVADASVEADVLSPDLPDDRCVNNAVRPCYTGLPQHVGVGICRAGMDYCLDGRWSGVCLGEVFPFDREFCNGVDDDCNGVIDDVPPRVCGAGACRVTVAGCARCTPLSAAPERCDGIDNDCDGTVDGPAADSSCRPLGDPHRADRCQEGRCVQAPPGACDPNWAQCPGTSTCNSDLQTSPEHCGRCDQRCASGMCVGGRCVTATRVDLPTAGRAAYIATNVGPVFACGSGMTRINHLAREPYRCGPLPELNDVFAVVQAHGSLCFARRDGGVTCRPRSLEPRSEVLFERLSYVRDVIDTVERDGEGIVLCASGEVRTSFPSGWVLFDVLAVLPDAVRLFPSDGSHVCVGTRDGAAACYEVVAGRRLQPIPLPPDSVAVAFRQTSFSCAVLRSGRVSCWGRLTFNPRDGDRVTPLPGVDMGLSGIRLLATNDTAACASQGPGGGTWCWGRVAALLDREESATPRVEGFPPTRVEGFDDLTALTLERRDTNAPQTLVGLTARQGVICRGYNRDYVCGETLSDRVGRTLLWGVE